MTGPQAVEAVGQELFAIADTIKADIQHSITAGAVSGRNHVASSPGEPPNADTGGLHRQVEAARTGPLKAEASSNAPHAIPLEYGTSRMQERPSVRPAVAKNRDKMAGRLAVTINRVNKATG